MKNFGFQDNFLQHKNKNAWTFRPVQRSVLKFHHVLTLAFYDGSLEDYKILSLLFNMLTDLHEKLHRY
jgi:hypothetical protein